MKKLLALLAGLVVAGTANAVVVEVTPHVSIEPIVAHVEDTVSVHNTSYTKTITPTVRSTETVIVPVVQAKHDKKKLEQEN